MSRLINRSFIKLKVMASLCSHDFIGYAGLQSRATGISGPWASISEQYLFLTSANKIRVWSMCFDFHGSISDQYLFLTSAIEIRVCQNPGAVHESRPSDIQIGEKDSPV